LFLTATAQFGFFDQMFGGGGGHQHQEPQNVRSDSSWYQAQYEAGTLLNSFAPLNLYPLTLVKLNAHTTSAPAPCHAYTSHTTAPAHGRA
jgi:hypothetical protein